MRLATLLSLNLLSLGIATACGGGGGDAPPPADAGSDAAAPDTGGGDGAAPMCPDRGARTLVFYGTLEPTYVPLSAGQVRAIGTFGGCSGTIIAPEWVLTAAHCGVRVGDRFCIGADPANPRTCYSIAQVENHGRVDTTLARLDRPATERDPDVVPIPIMTERVTSTWIGRTAEAAGYGRTETGDYGTRKFTAEVLAAIDGEFISIDGMGERGVCEGDSGGPLMVIATDGTIRVTGDLTGGEGSCTGVDNYTRVDTNVAWVESFTGPTIVEGAGCGGVTAEGRCIDGAALYCDGDAVVRTECDAACGWDPAANGYRCVTEDPCGGVDGYGRCEGDVAVWCHGGEVRRRDCAACGGDVCGVVPGAGGVYCQPDPCMGVDYLGRCTGDVAEWCEDGALQRVDCGARGQRCDFVNDSVGWFCT